MVHITNYLANFEGILISKWLIKFEDNCSCDQKIILIKYSFHFILAEKSGIDGAVFVHASGFIGGCKSKEGALAMAVETIKLSEL